MSGSEHPGVPLRHPRPLTAAELYEQCEKEQEAVVGAYLIIDAFVQQSFANLITKGQPTDT